jgi:hypothetical protein
LWAFHCYPYPEGGEIKNEKLKIREVGKEKREEILSKGRKVDFYKELLYTLSSAGSPIGNK